jgi:hypothetical protein
MPMSAVLGGSSLRKHSTEQSDIDSKLIWATDIEDLSTVGSIILSTPPNIAPSPEAVSKAFEFAIAKGNLALLELFLRGSSPVDRRTLTEQFRLSAREGTDPHLIAFLQNYVSGPDYLEESRYHQLLREKGELRESGHYLPDVQEEADIRSVHRKLSTIEADLGSTNRSTRTNAKLRGQFIINDILLDATLGGRKLLLVHLLRSNSVLQPSQSAVNSVLVTALSRNFYSVADILVRGACAANKMASANDEGFYDAFVRAIEEENSGSLQWLLSGRFGLRPPQEIIDSSYEKAEVESAFEPTIPNHSQSLRRSRVEVERTREAAAERVQSKRTILEILRRNVSAETIAAVDTLIRRRRAQIAQQHQRRRLFQLREGPDIHQYARTHVEDVTNNAEDGATEEVQLDEAHGAIRGQTGRGDQSVHVRRTLNDAILHHMQTRVPSASFTIDSVSGRLTRLIYDTFTEQSDITRAERIIEDLMSPANLPIFGTTIAFLDSIQTPQNRVFEIWMNGFLSESIAVNSCNPGALERVVTGLRGIGDTQLDELFGRSEGPHLANAFLKGTFNIFYEIGDATSRERAERNAERLASILVSRGATLESTEGDVERILIDYAEEAILQYGVEITRYRDDIRVIMQTIADAYDTHLRSFVTRALSGR